jgi:hypothetical protein
MYGTLLCLSWIKKSRTKDKTYIWYTSRIHWLTRGTGTPKDKDEVNKRDVSECDGWVCVFEVIGSPSVFKLTRRTTVMVRVLPTFSFRVNENDMYGCRCNQRLKAIINKRKRGPEREYIINRYTWGLCELNCLCCLIIIIILESMRYRTRFLRWVKNQEPCFKKEKIKVSPILSSPLCEKTE